MLRLRWPISPAGLPPPASRHCCCCCAAPASPPAAPPCLLPAASLRPGAKWAACTHSALRQMGHLKLSCPLCCSQARRQGRWNKCPHGSCFAAASLSLQMAHSASLACSSFSAASGKEWSRLWVAALFRMHSTHSMHSMSAHYIEKHRHVPSSTTLAASSRLVPSVPNSFYMLGLTYA